MNADVETKELVRFHQRHRTIVFIYVFHWCCILSILIMGMIKNGGDRKYVPVDPAGLISLLQTKFINGGLAGISCLKAYVDVHTSSIEDELAFVCCTKQGPFFISNMSLGWEQYQYDLCNPRIPYLNISMKRLPFSMRLTRFPEAWILPMLPILIRLIYQIISHLWFLIKPTFKICNELKSRSMSSGLSTSSLLTSVPEKVVLTTSVESNTANTQSSNFERTKVTIQRIFFYFILLNIRGWGLYIGANAIEDYFIVPLFTGKKVISPLRIDSVSDVEHSIQSSNHDCWYKDVLKAHHRSAMESEYYSDCYGRPFDFSDHIVLFLAHYLPIFFMEMLICWMLPFWISPNQTAPPRRFITEAFAALHLALFVYMYLIVLHATYQTTAYFHTSGEIFVGYLISWFLQCPIMYLLCSEKWGSLREFIGLPVGQAVAKNAVKSY
jgi:hypothetical protein